MLRNSSLRKLDVEFNQFSHLVYRDIGTAVVGNKKVAQRLTATAVEQ